VFGSTISLCHLVYAYLVHGLCLLIHSALFHWVHVLILGIGLLLERRIGDGCYRIRLLLQFSDVAIWNKVSKALESHRITMKWCNS